MCQVRSLFEIVRSEGFNSCNISGFHYQIHGCLAKVPSEFVGGAPLICALQHCDRLTSLFVICHVDFFFHTPVKIIYNSAHDLQKIFMVQPLPYHLW